ncbi:MAG: glycogen debranching enzyme GlgX, partial [Pirellulaceae bacterium]|nr:glycogen debranching enzyme GlgX [Pirellulaceae bacterium]
DVFLDVFYNHSAVGNQMGPTLSWRGIEILSYYHLSPEHPSYYMDFTGCGNTPNPRHPRTLQMIMDSLRYWVTEMHIDGFRFDLAATLGRSELVVDHMSAFFSIIHQDPVLSQVKLIAEPWDVGPDGYQVGRFPVIWGEWNGRYRDSIRRFWKGDGGLTSEFATRISGSSDLYMDDGRRPSASVNFITCHDGFNLHDLVSYNDKHNEANGENNRDGSSSNDSWNCGIEGPTDDAEILVLRERQKRNYRATLLLSQGVPMLLAGDEIGHTQQGNNNCYCQDSDLSWLDWNLTPERELLLDFTRRLLHIRRTQPALRRRRFFHGAPIFGTNVKDIYWLDHTFHEMTEDAWNAGFVKAMGVVLIGENGEINDKGEPIVGDNLMLILNAHWEPIEFDFPRVASIATNIERLFDTADPSAAATPHDSKNRYKLESRSTALFRWQMPKARQ